MVERFATAMPAEGVPTTLPAARTHWREDLPLAIGLTVVHFVYALAIQHRITVAGGLGWDGNAYFRMASGKLSDGVYPFAERIGVPLVVKYLPFSNLMTSFAVLNFLFAFAFSVLFFLLLATLKDDLSPLTKITAWCLLCMTQVSPIVFTAWYPVHNDSVSNGLMMLLLYLLLSGVRSPVAYFMVLFYGTLVRENFPLFLVFALVVCQVTPLSHPYVRWMRQLLWLNRDIIVLVIAGIVGAACAMMTALQIAPYNPFNVKGGDFVKYFSERLLVAAGAAGVNIYGPAFLFYLLYRGQAQAADAFRHPLWRRRWNFFVPVIVIMVIGIGGGSNVERYLFWALPLVVLYLTPYIDELVKARHYVLWVYGAVFMLVFQRALLPIDVRGIAECDLRSIVVGTSTWLGHWVQICSNRQALQLVFAYSGICVLAVALSKVAASRTGTPA